MSLAKVDEPAACLFCNQIVHEPAQHRHDPEMVKLKIPLKGSIVTPSGTIDLNTIEAESQAYTGGRSGFAEEDNPAAVVAARQTDFTRPPSSRHTGKLRAVRYRAIRILLLSLMAAGAMVFVWQMIVYLTRPQAN